MRVKYIIMVLAVASLCFLGGCALFRQQEQKVLYKLQIECPPDGTSLHNIPEIVENSEILVAGA